MPKPTINAAILNMGRILGIILIKPILILPIKTIIIMAIIPKASDAAFYKIPTNKDLIAQELFLFANSGSLSYWYRKPDYSDKTNNLPQVDHIQTKFFWELIWLPVDNKKRTPNGTNLIWK
jgi:hypothetical protein